MGVIYSSQIIILSFGIYTTMAPNGKAFSSQIKRMSKKPLKYNPEEVMVRKVDMAQDMFNFAMDVARECMGKLRKKMSLAWLNMLLTDSMKSMGNTGCPLLATTMELM